MHNAALRAPRAGRLALPAAADPAGRLRRHRAGAERAGFRGVNVTIPHKEAALAVADAATATARAVGAANTLTLRGRARAGRQHGRGTVCCERSPPRTIRAARRALVLGAGGAGRAAVSPCCRPARATCRSGTGRRSGPSRCAAELGGRAVTRPGPARPHRPVHVRRSHVTDDAFKGLPLNADAFGAGTCVVDMVYRDGGTAFLAAARARGADVVDGLEVLVGQGAAALERWTGRSAPIDVMRRAVDRTPAPMNPTTHHRGSPAAGARRHAARRAVAGPAAGSTT